MNIPSVIKVTDRAVVSVDIVLLVRECQWYGDVLRDGVDKEQGQ